MALPILRTPRLVLRPLRADDTDALVRGVGNFDVSKWLAVVPYPYDRRDAAAFLETVVGTGRLVWGICESGQLVGVLGLENELGYWLARPAWGRGLGYEAAQAATEFWFSNPGRPDLKSGYFDGNDRSAAILRSLGFRPDGRERRPARALSQDVESTRMRLTRPDWTRRMAFVVETRRLRLRPLHEGDAAFLTRLARPEIARNLSGLPAHLDEAGAREIIAGRLWRGYPGFNLAVERAGEVVGILGAGRSPLSVMMAIHPDHWRQGYASEAMRAFVTALFSRFPVSRIVTERFEDNPASGRVLEKTGFRRTGHGTCTSLARLEPDASITYALTREEWRQWHSPSE